jgi:hypothetical protein
MLCDPASGAIVSDQHDVMDETETRLMKKTAVFAAAVALLLAFTYYFEFYRVDEEAKQKDVAAKIVSFLPEQIHEITVENSSGKTLLKRDADGWRLEEPVKDWADNTFTEDFVNGLANEKSLDVASEGDRIQWSAFGLDKSFSKISFVNQQGAAITISVSEKKNFEGNSLLRREQENRVLVASPEWAERAKKQAIDFRDKRLFRGKIGGIDALSIQSQKDKFELSHKKDLWVSESQPTWALDQNKVRELLTALNEISAAEYLQTVPTTAALKTRVTLKIGEKNWTAELRQTPENNNFAVTSDPQFSMKLAPGKVDKFLDLTLDSLRDRKEPFGFKNLAVRRIELQSELKKTILVKEKDDWKVDLGSGTTDAKNVAKGDLKAVEKDIQKAAEKNAVDNEAVKNFIAKLSQSEVSEYVSPAEAKAFQNPGNRIVLKDEKQQVLFDLSWGPTVQRKAPALTKVDQKGAGKVDQKVAGKPDQKAAAAETVLVLAKSNLFKDVFALDHSVIDSWALQNLFMTRK